MVRYLRILKSEGRGQSRNGGAALPSTTTGTTS
jgi:hypothetical protein